MPQNKKKQKRAPHIRISNRRSLLEELLDEKTKALEEISAVIDRRNFLCKVTNLKMDDNQFLQAGLPAVKGGLDVSSARLLALPALLASAVEAKNP